MLLSTQIEKSDSDKLILVYGPCDFFAKNSFCELMKMNRKIDLKKWRTKCFGPSNASNYWSFYSTLATCYSNWQVEAFSVLYVFTYINLKRFKKVSKLNHLLVWCFLLITSHYWKVCFQMSIFIARQLRIFGKSLL